MTAIDSKETPKPNGPFRPTLFPLVVVDSQLITRRTRRLTLSGEQLALIEAPKPAQWVKLFPELSGISRHGRAYTIRCHDRTARTIEIDVTLHGKGRFARWAESVEPGAKLESSLPCGVCRIPANARRCIFAGDETAAPAILTILQALPQDMHAEAFIEVEDSDEIPTAAENKQSICWLSRDAGKYPVGALLKATLGTRTDFDATDIWLAGEQHMVATLREHCLSSCGTTGRSLQAAGYWKLGTKEHRDQEGDY